MVPYLNSISKNAIILIEMAAPFFPPKTISKMKNLGISESSVLDVFNTGEAKTLPSGMKAMVKKYNGYEIGVGYTSDSNTGEYVVVAVWKRERR